MVVDDKFKRKKRGGRWISFFALHTWGSALRCGSYIIGQQQKSVQPGTWFTGSFYPNKQIQFGKENVRRSAGRLYLQSNDDDCKGTEQQHRRNSTANAHAHCLVERWKERSFASQKLAFFGCENTTIQLACTVLARWQRICSVHTMVVDASRVYTFVHAGAYLKVRRKL